MTQLHGMIPEELLRIYAMGCYIDCDGGSMGCGCILRVYGDILGYPTLVYLIVTFRLDMTILSRFVDPPFVGVHCRR